MNDVVQLAMALHALSIPEEQIALAIAAYIEEHPEAIAEVTVATVADTQDFLGILVEDEEEEEA